MTWETPRPSASGDEPGARQVIPRDPWSDAGSGYPPGTPVPPGAGGSGPWASGHSQPAGRYVLSGWWRRVGAAVIDGLIILAVAAAVMVPVGVALFREFTGTGAGTADAGGDALLLTGAGLVAYLIVLTVGLLYAPVMLWKTNGKTVGRMATGIRVVRASGQPMTLGLAAVREIVIKGIVVGGLAQFTFAIVFFLDVLWPLWDEENRALHDFPIKTRTVLD